MKRKVAIIIKTTYGRKSLLWVLQSARFAFEDNIFRFYIADEEPLDDWKKVLYEKLKQEGHFIKIWMDRTAVTVARNDLIDNLLDEDYVVRVDDDFEFGGEFSFNSILKVLESSDDIDFCSDMERQIGQGKGVTSGSSRIGAGIIEINSDRAPPTLTRFDDRDWVYRRVDGTRYAKADYMRNMIVLKRRCFETSRWNDRLYFQGEHLDFFLTLKKNGFQGAFTPDSIHLHRDDIKTASIDMAAERAWRHDRTGQDAMLRQRVMAETWGGKPVVLRKSRVFSRLRHHGRKLLNQYRVAPKNLDDA
jgi:hypothetical protein